jgi:O-antigen/teichoic acid export membrane protein
MTAHLQEKIRDFFTKGHERTILTKKNIAAAFGIKGITILISILLIPMTINYVNPDRNGIWLTLYSMIFWLSLFDIGLGNGLRNKLTEAKAQGDDEAAKKYISSTYAIVGVIFTFIFILFCLINPHLDWVKILGENNAAIDIYRDEISGLVWIFMVSFCLIFVLNLLKAIVLADQRPAIGSFLDMLGQMLTLIGIFILTKTTSPSLVALGWVSCFSPIAVYIVAHIYFFNTRYRKWQPSFRSINMKLSMEMINLGLRFFVITVTAMTITLVLPFLILRISGPEEVTNFNTSFRLFAVAYNVLGIIVVPYWSSFTDAYIRQDFAWMQRAIAKLRQCVLYVVIFEVIILSLSPFIYYIWINYWMVDADNKLDISFLMSLSICVSVCTSCWLNACIYPLNGTGKIKLQMYSSIWEILLLIPLALWMGSWWGAPGVIFASSLIYFPRMIWAPIQLNKLINRTAKGIWNK